MKHYLFIIAACTFLTSCKSTKTNIEHYADLKVTQEALLSNNWQQLKRFPPKYPIEDAKAGREGCAEVEYVVTPDYQIKDIKVLNSTSRFFAKQAKLNVKKWSWSNLPNGIIKAPIKTVTRFEFCLEQGDGHCTNKPTFDNNQCSAHDVIYSVGYKFTSRSDSEKYQDRNKI